MIVPMTTSARLAFAVLAASLMGASRAGAQSGAISGVVADSAGKPLVGVEVNLPELKRRTHTTESGSFRFDRVDRGTWNVSVRRIGFLPESRRVAVDSAEIALGFRLVPTAAVLPSLVTAASQLGLSGTVVDTAGNPVRGARVRVLSTGKSAETDSAGAFWIGVPSGGYMVAVSKDKYAQRLTSVTIPPDSGRRIAVWLRPAVAIPVREAHNVDDLRERLSFVIPQRRVTYTREMLEKEGIVEIFDAVNRTGSRFGAKLPIGPDCMVVLNGGPAMEVLGALRTDQVEFVEVYRSFPTNTATSQGARFGQLSNTDEARKINQAMSLVVTCLGVYVWLR